MLQAIAEMSPDEKANYRMQPGALSPVHFRAIQRIYGAWNARLGSIRGCP